MRRGPKFVVFCSITTERPDSPPSWICYQLTPLLCDLRHILHRRWLPDCTHSSIRRNTTMRTKARMIAALTFALGLPFAPLAHAAGGFSPYPWGQLRTTQELQTP